MKQHALAVLFGAILASFAAPTFVSGQVPSSSASNPAAPDVVLRPGDVIRITVWPNAEASGEFTIEDSGYIMLPLLEAVPAAGVPVGELRADLRRRYGQAMRNPVVTVTPMFRVTVTGEVMRPGIHTITPTVSLYEVIALAGGFRPQANAEKVRIVRDGHVIEYDALRALQTGHGMDAIQLRSGDHIVVPTRRRPITFGNFLTVLQTASLIILTYERFTRTR